MLNQFKEVQVMALTGVNNQSLPSAMTKGGFGSGLL